jgi:16S rRNA (cytidine1402-2'-O)-methyltransferase
VSGTINAICGIIFGAALPTSVLAAGSAITGCSDLPGVPGAVSGSAAGAAVAPAGAVLARRNGSTDNAHEASATTKNSAKIAHRIACECSTPDRHERHIRNCPRMSEKQPVALYVVATPIGNLGDMTARALDTLRGVDVIAAEDTRNTKSLLAHFGISARLIAVHDHNEEHAAEGLVKLLREGQSVALVTDAGTPAVSDPGAKVVAAVREAGFDVVPVPGVSALVTALSASGVGEGGFVFRGFLPPRAGDRARALEALKSAPYALVFYESPHRVVESVAAMASVFGDARHLIICRELTKKFETIVRLKLSDAVAWLEADSNNQRGEFVLVLSEPATHAHLEAEAAETAELERTLKILLAALPLKQAVAIAVEITGEKKNRVYEMALALKE